MVHVELGRGVADLLWRQGESALTVELTIDFEHDVTKHAVAFVGAGEPTLGFRCHRVDGIDVWWRQRFWLGGLEPRVAGEIRPRRLVVGRVGSALCASADYA